MSFQKRLDRDRDACLPGGLTTAELQATFRAASMLRYGVAIDHRDYRVLRGGGGRRRRPNRAAAKVPTQFSHGLVGHRGSANL